MEVSRMSKGMLIKTGVGLVLAAIIIPIVIIGGVWADIVVALISVLAAYEIASLFDQKPHWYLTILFTLWIELIAYTPVSWFAAVAAGLLVFLFVIMLVHEEFQIDHVVYSFLLILIVSLGWQAVIRYYHSGFNGLGILYVGLACFICDTGAYFFGVFTGKHKMIPRISPNKTWEGAIGGYFSGLFVSLVFGYLACPFLPKSLIIAGSLVLPAIAEIGDLAFSSVKRRFGIKDFGSLIPGHGGILDRIDSLLFCLFVFNGMMILWGFGL